MMNHMPIGKDDEKNEQEDKKMRKMIMIAIIMLWVCMNLLSAASGSFNANWVPADSKWVIHIDHTTFSKTKLFSILDKNWHGKEKSIKSEIFDELHIDLGKDVKGLTIAGMKRIGRQDNLLVIFQGAFDERLIIKKLKQKEKKYRSLNLSKLIVHRWDGDNYLFFPAKDVFVFCETSKGIEEIVALQTGAKKGLSNSSHLAKMINEAPANAFVRAAAIDISELARHSPKTMILGNAAMAFFIAMERNDNLSVLLKLATESAEKAQNLQQIITGLKALVNLKAMDRKDETFMPADLLGALNVNTKQNNLEMTFDYPVAKIEKLIENKKKKHTIHVRADDSNEDEEDEG